MKFILKGNICVTILSAFIILFITLYTSITSNRRLTAYSGVASFRSITSPSLQELWIENSFKAADPSEQEWCTEALRLGTKSHGMDAKGAQFGQDVFIARNLFFDYVMSGKKGFYVEAGANHPERLSGTYFFDKCLGWDGLCVEPQKQYHDLLEKRRSCTVVPMCLSDKKGEMVMYTRKNSGPGRSVQDLKVNATYNKGYYEKVQCAPLTEFLPSGRTHIDLFILDVEGAENIVLNTIDWKSLTFGALMIEDNNVNLNNRKLDYDMNMRRYIKFQQLHIDSLYADPSLAFGINEIWYPPQWHEFAQINKLAPKSE